MIVRISGHGQFELDDAAVHHLHELDTTLTAALHAGQEAEFHRLLASIIAYIEENGSPLPHERVAPSDIIVPPGDVSMDEAQQFFTDEGLMQPVQA